MHAGFAWGAMLLPYLDQAPRFQQISSAGTYNGTAYNPFGPVPWDGNYTPWQGNMPVMQCPSDIDVTSTIGTNNYRFCLGTTLNSNEWDWNNNANGLFGGRPRAYRIRDCLDGSSNTIAMGVRNW